MSEKTLTFSEPSPPYSEANPYPVITSEKGEAEVIKLWSESRDQREDELKTQLRVAEQRYARAYCEQSIFLLFILLILATALAFAYTHDVETREHQCKVCIETVLQGNLTSMPPCAKLT